MVIQYRVLNTHFHLNEEDEEEHHHVEEQKDLQVEGCKEWIRIAK